MTTPARILRCSATALAIALPTLPATAQKAPATRLNTTPPGATFAFTPQICAAGDQVYACWTDTRSLLSDIYFNRSLDRGQTWLAQDIRLDTDGPGASLAANPQMTCQGDNVYVVWSDLRNGGTLVADIYLNVSTDAGATWLASDIRINTDPLGNAAARCPEIAADANGGVYVAWVDNRNGKNDIYFNRSLDNGATWLANDVRLDTDPAGAGESTCPGICADAGKVYVGWNDGRNGNTDNYFNRSLDGGTTWLANDVRVDTDPLGAANSSAVAMACTGLNVYWAWWDSRNGEDDIYFNRSLDGGATWLASDIRLDVGDPPGANLSAWPEVCCEGNTVYVTWEDWRNGSLVLNADVYFQRSTDAGATWLMADVLVSRGNVPYGGGGSVDHSPAIPKLACDGKSIHVAWGDIRNGPQNVYYNRSTDGGDTWLVNDIQLAGDATNAAAAPFLAADDEGIYVTWQDSRSGQSDIYMTIPRGRQPYGTGTAGSGGITPTLSGDGDGSLGSGFAMHAKNALGGASGAFILGTAKTSQPVFGGTLLVMPMLGIPAAFAGTPGLAGDGSASLGFTVPDDEAVIGMSVYCQVLVLDGSGVSMTNGVELWIG